MTYINFNNSQKRIAFIANEANKTELIHWLYFNRQLFENHEIIATGFPLSNILQGTLNTKVHTLVAGNFGGDQQLMKMIEEGKVDMIIFFGDGMEVKDYDKNDVQALLQVAAKAGIIVAANNTTAKVILNGLATKDHFTYSEAV